MSPEVPVIVLIIAVLVYFLSKWILKLLNLGRKENRKFIAIVPSIILSPLIYIGIIMIWIFCITYHPTEKFSKERWNTNIEERYTMSKDIIESKILIGKTKNEVIDFLGNDFYEYNEDHISYNLGFATTSIGLSVLDIFFENGRVTKVNHRIT